MFKPVISLIHPMHLNDKCLHSEMKALIKVWKLSIKAQDGGKLPESIVIPTSYRLGTGHFLFFLDRMTWVFNRICAIHNEMRLREITSYSINWLYSKTEEFDNMGEAWKKDFDPSHDEMYISMARLVTNSNLSAIAEELLCASKDVGINKKRKAKIPTLSLVDAVTQGDNYSDDSAETLATITAELESDTPVSKAERACYLEQRARERAASSRLQDDALLQFLCPPLEKWLDHSRTFDYRLAYLEGKLWSLPTQESSMVG